MHRVGDEGEESLVRGIPPDKDNSVVRDDFGASRSDGGGSSFCG